MCIIQLYTKGCFLKIRFLFLLFILTVSLQANGENYVLNTSGLIDKRATIKINTMGTEVKQKLGVNIYLDVKGDNGINPELPLKERIAMMKKKEADLVSNLKQPYAVLTIALDQKYSNILMTPDVKKMIDRDDILDGYVIPLLAAKDKNTLSSKVSAASLNGYAQIADSIADANNMELNSSIGSQGKIASTIWKVFMYSVVLFGIVIYFVIILREKKIRKEQEENGQNNG
jgi:hypothetical protein